MKIFTEQEIDTLFSYTVGSGDFQRDNSGQVVIYTGVFEWDDGTFRDEPESKTNS